MPRQERSRATVDALVEATARVLTTEGYDRLTTNRIAQVAGVGVGSLYQYFPNKEALLEAVIDRHFTRITAVMSGVRIELRDAPLDTLVRATIARILAIHEVDPELHAALDLHLRPLALERRRAMRQAQLQVLELWLTERFPHVDAERARNAAWVLDVSVQAVMIETMATGRQPVEALTEEVVQMALGYLERVAVPRRISS